jgi:Flp pilus assembly protein TadB
VAFNTALWDAHREELARHQADLQRTRQEELEAARRLQQERQALGEAIAREVAAREGMARSRAPLRFAAELLVLGVLALVLLPLGPLARGLFFLLLGAVCVRAVVAWARSRPVEDDPEDQSSVDR